MHTDGRIFIESQRDRQPGSVKDFRFEYVGHDTPANSLLAILRRTIPRPLCSSHASFSSYTCFNLRSPRLIPLLGVVYLLGGSRARNDGIEDVAYPGARLFVVESRYRRVPETYEMQLGEMHNFTMLSTLVTHEQKSSRYLRSAVSSTSGIIFYL